MINKLRLIFFMLSFGSAIITGQNCAVLNIETNEESSMIYLNGKYAGSGKLHVNLETGDYKILIIQRGKGWNSQRINDSLRINNCTDVITREYRFKNSVLLKTIPQNVYIYHSDSLYAFSPAELDYSLHTVRLSKKNYEPKLVVLADIKPEFPVVLDFLGADKKEDFVDSPWFTVLLSSAVALGAAAAHFKIQADQKYSRYQITKDKRLLNDVDKYDHYSGVAFGLLQLNFGYLIYEFLFDNP